MSKLKPCPFCGNNKLQTVTHFTEDGYYCAVVCSECSLEMLSDGWSDPQSAEEEVTAKWNKRVEPPTPGGAIVPAGNARLKR